jgi:DUF4097 and DUF4098 domain-containing protein YvlB
MEQINWMGTDSDPLQRLQVFADTLEQLEADYEEIKRDAVGNEVTLTEEQEEELEKVRQAAAAATVTPRRDLAALNRNLTSARAKAAKHTEDLDEAKKTLTETEGQVTTASERKEKLTSVSSKFYLVCLTFSFVCYYFLFANPSLTILP